MKQLRTLLRQGRSSDSRGQGMVEFAIVAPLLFVMALGVFEVARFVFYYEVVNHAAREGARYAIVNGSRSSCPSGPPPNGQTNPCDPTGSNVRSAVEDAAFELMASGELIVHDPVWTSRGSLGNPEPGDPSTGSNARGEYVTVFVDYTYDPMIAQILDLAIVPSIALSAESTLVINT